MEMTRLLESTSRTLFRESQAGLFLRELVLELFFEGQVFEELGLVFEGRVFWWEEQVFSRLPVFSELACLHDKIVSWDSWDCGAWLIKPQETIFLMCEEI